MTGLECFLVFLCLFALYKYGTRYSNYWKSRGVKELSMNLPFLGNNYKNILQLENALETGLNFYNSFKGNRYGGIYIFQKPFLLIRDPELVKHIFVKDVEYFFNHHDWDSKVDPMMSRSLTNLQDEEWRNLRLVMTTVFTGSKMKDMFTFMNKCGEQASEYLQAKLKKQASGKSTGNIVLDVDFKDFFSRYAADVIASTAFGIEVDSYKQPKNEFHDAGMLVSNAFLGLNGVKIMIMMLLPTLSKMLGLKLFGSTLNDFLYRTVTENIREREARKIVRKDMIHILTEARKSKEVNNSDVLVKGKLPDLTDLDIAAQAMLFFIAGFDVVSTVLAFTCYELALNPDIQRNLHEELDAYPEANYENIMHNMPYFSMVLNETCRKWPPAVMTDRRVTKTYVIPKTDTEPELVLKPGDNVFVSIAGFHRDPQYFPEPEKFDPERFRDEKATITPYTYLPFGGGLRHCIGMRFAMMEMKTILYHILKKFEIVPIDKTDIPLTLEKANIFLLRARDGVWLGLKPRN